ncbi:hypothetical protein R3P38DRAFT_3278262 [Favolaschia claudopus]|uniref:Uncharacterized protein n=1 Tax=Favolaschia claudopus TaxID=2862362 RepID=A0AAW0AJJ4_9AGAR
MAVATHRLKLKRATCRICLGALEVHKYGVAAFNRGCVLDNDLMPFLFSGPLRVSGLTESFCSVLQSCRYISDILFTAYGHDARPNPPPHSALTSRSHASRVRRHPAHLEWFYACVHSRRSIHSAEHLPLETRVSGNRVKASWHQIKASQRKHKREQAVVIDKPSKYRNSSHHGTCPVPQTSHPRLLRGIDEENLPVPPLTVSVFDRSDKSTCWSMPLG